MTNTATAVSAGALAKPSHAIDLPSFANDYEYRALAAFARLAKDRALDPRDAQILLIEQRVACDVRSLAAACALAEQYADAFKFETTRRTPSSADRAVLRRQLGQFA